MTSKLATSSSPVTHLNTESQGCHLHTIDVLAAKASE